MVRFGVEDMVELKKGEVDEGKTKILRAGFEFVAGELPFPTPCSISNGFLQTDPAIGLCLFSRPRSRARIALHPTEEAKRWYWRSSGTQHLGDKRRARRSVRGRPEIVDGVLQGRAKGSTVHEGRRVGEPGLGGLLILNQNSTVAALMLSVSHVSIWFPGLQEGISTRD